MLEEIPAKRLKRTVSRSSEVPERGAGGRGARSGGHPGPADTCAAEHVLSRLVLEHGDLPAALPQLHVAPVAKLFGLRFRLTVILALQIDSVLYVAVTADHVRTIMLHLTML